MKPRNDFLDELTKKDEDAELVEYDNFTGSMIVSTRLNIGEEIDIEGEIDRALQEVSQGEPHIDVLVQLIRLIFLINAAVAFEITIVGFLPEELMQYALTRKINAYILGNSAFLSCVLYFVMIVYREHQYAIFILVSWLGSVFCLCVSLSALIEDIIIMQFTACVALQSVSVIAYSFYNRTEIDAWKSFYIMITVGISVWLLNIYSFVIDSSVVRWVFCVLLLFSIVGTSSYCALQIHRISRYSLSYKDRVLAVIQFYGDPAIEIWNKING